MNCSNCGTYNAPQSKFCIKCGNDLTANNVNQEQPQSMNQNIDVQQSINQNVDMQQPMQNQQQFNQNNNFQQPVQQSNVNTAPLNYIMYLIAILLKPIKCFREEESKLNNSKTAFLLSLVVTVIMTLSNLAQTIISTVRVGSFSWSSGGYTYSWQWDNLKNIKWIEVIGKNFLIYACIIFAITIVFYLGSLVVKKQLSFIKSLSVSATSVIPAVIGAMILSPILGMIWSPLSMAFTIIGLVYSLIILYELVNDELKLESNMKVYFNLICFSILIIAGYYAFMKLFMSSVTGGLDNILDLFG